MEPLLLGWKGDKHKEASPIFGDPLRNPKRPAVGAAMRVRRAAGLLRTRQGICAMGRARFKLECPTPDNPKEKPNIASGKAKPTKARKRGLVLDFWATSFTLKVTLHFVRKKSAPKVTTDPLPRRQAHAFMGSKEIGEGLNLSARLWLMPAPHIQGRQTTLKSLNYTC